MKDTNPNRSELVQALHRITPDALADMVSRYTVAASDGDQLTLDCRGRRTAHTRPGRVESVALSGPGEVALAELSGVLLAMFAHEAECHP